MSESGSLSDEGFPSSSSRFELAMLESSRPLLESCTKETLDDLRNCQTLANIGSSSFMSVGEGVLCDAIPIFRSEFTSDHLEKNLLDSEKQLEALRQSCSIPCSIRMRLVHHEELPFEPPKGTIKFSGRELVDVEKMLRVPKEDRHLGKLRPLFQKYGFQPLVSECQRRARRRSIIDELGEPLDENESDRDQIMRLSSYVMTEYDDRLREVKWYKVKFKENNSKDDSDNEASVDEQSRESDDGSGDSDIVRGSALDEDDS
ncbi:hypothetical protein D8674_038288 [Pyrus ussuriensis x Pyrus communis]|uniref:Uncharacterized protein n=1 Tax=Pyrus ussuriensis x Pyrus communis TaxID=2448454 RepID=A0A5N5I2K5_9ROSA|nr:hypothetical protein D8674_038288 [Pyrus ussuriensis x Pyrus communis]